MHICIFFLLCLEPISIPFTPQRNLLMCLRCILMSATALTKCAMGASVHLFLTYGNISLRISFLFFPLSTMLLTFTLVALCTVLNCWVRNTVRYVSTRTCKAVDSQPVTSSPVFSFLNSSPRLHGCCMWTVCAWPNILPMVPRRYD